MAKIIIENNKKEFQSVETGVYDAVCFKQVDLGTHETYYKGIKVSKRKVRVSWELLTKLMEDNRPFVISKTYTMCIWGESALKKDLQNWRGKAFTDEEANRFDLSKVLGVSCKLMVSNEIGDSNKKYTRITSISPNQKFTVEKTHNEILSFSLDNFEKEVFDKLSEYEKKLIMLSPEYKALNLIDTKAVAETTAEENLEEEEIPF